MPGTGKKAFGLSVNNDNVSVSEAGVSVSDRPVKKAFYMRGFLKKEGIDLEKREQETELNEKNARKLFADEQEIRNAKMIIKDFMQPQKRTQDELNFRLFGMKPEDYERVFLKKKRKSKEKYKRKKKKVAAGSDEGATSSVQGNRSRVPGINDNSQDKQSKISSLGRTADLDDSESAGPSAFNENQGDQKLGSEALTKSKIMKLDQHEIMGKIGSHLRGQVELAKEEMNRPWYERHYDKAKQRMLDYFEEQSEVGCSNMIIVSRENKAYQFFTVIVMISRMTSSYLYAYMAAFRMHSQQDQQQMMTIYLGFEVVFLLDMLL